MSSGFLARIDKIHELLIKRVKRSVSSGGIDCNGIREGKQVDVPNY